MRRSPLTVSYADLLTQASANVSDRQARYNGAVSRGVGNLEALSETDFRSLFELVNK